MSEPFRILFSCDEAHHVVRATASGHVDGPAYAGEYLRFFNALPEPWRYDRLTDLMQCTGFVGFEILAHLAAFWTPYAHRFTTPRKVAVASPNRLVIARMPVVSQMFQGQDQRAFATLAEAEAWLGIGDVPDLTPVVPDLSDVRFDHRA